MLGFALKKTLSFLATPLSVALMLMALGLGVARRAGWGRRSQIMVGLGIATLLLSGNRFVAVALLRPLETEFSPVAAWSDGSGIVGSDPGVAAIVILAGGLEPRPGFSANHRLGPTGLARSVEGIRLAKLLPDVVVVVCGPDESGAATVVRFLEQSGVNPRRMVTLSGAPDTEGEARAVAARFGRQKVALVTSAWHLPRATRWFSAAGIEAVACPADFATETPSQVTVEDFLWNAGALNLTTLALRERLGLLWLTLRTGRE